jgi:hypothetical protein
MQNLHSSEPPQNFLRPPKLQLYIPVIGSNIGAVEVNFNLFLSLFFFSRISRISKFKIFLYGER